MKEYNKNVLITLLACTVIIPFISACEAPHYKGEIDKKRGLYDRNVGHIDGRLILERGIGAKIRRTHDYYQKATDRGDPKGMVMLGHIYRDGYGVAKDYTKAVELYTKAAEMGNAMGQCSLGAMYYNGYGVKQDYSKAVEWYTRAAQQGFSDAQYNLGIMYYKGYGVKQDYSKAVEWYTRAANLGDTDAKAALEVARKKVNGGN